MKKLVLIFFLFISFNAFNQLFSKAKIFLVNDVSTYCDFTIKIDFDGKLITFGKDPYYIVDVTVLALNEIKFQCLDKNGLQCNITLAENLVLPQSCSQSFYVEYNKEKFYLYLAEPVKQK